MGLLEGHLWCCALDFPPLLLLLILGFFLSGFSSITFLVFVFATVNVSFTLLYCFSKRVLEHDTYGFIRLV